MLGIETEKETTSTRDVEEFLKTARDRFKRSSDAEVKIRSEALSDLRFLAGDQWIEANKTMRENDPQGKRPCLVMDRLGQMTRLVANEIHQSRPGVKFLPVDDKADIDTAEVFQAIARHIERNSDSSIPYGFAVDYQVRSGFGYVGFTTRYVNTTNDDQELLLRSFPNPFSVYGDPDGEELDGSDWQWAFVTDDHMSRVDFVKEYKADPTSATEFSGIGDTADGWISEGKVRVAEYWWVENETKTLSRLHTGQWQYRDDLLQRYTAEQLKGMVSKEREVKIPSVKWAIINGHEILEEGDWPGGWIPIVRVLGEVMIIDGETQIFGLIRHAKEPQRIVNYMFSLVAESVALSPRTPWIAAAGQIDDFMDEWKRSNIRIPVVLRYKPVETAAGQSVAPPQRNAFEPPIQAMVMGLQMAESSLRYAVGLHEPSTGSLSSERSGRAIGLLQQQGSISTYHFSHNFGKGMRALWRQLIGDGLRPGLAQKVYDRPGRILRIIGEDDSERTIVLGRNGETALPPGVDKIYDLSVGLYDVTSEMGQAFASKRQEAFAAMSQIFQSQPDLLRIFGDVWFRNADFPGAQEMSKRAKMLLPPELRGEEGGQAPIPPEFQQKMQQIAQQFQQLQKAYQEQAEIIRTKRLELDSKERIEAGKMEIEAAKMQLQAIVTATELQSKEALAAFEASLEEVRQNIEILRQEQEPEPATVGE